MDIKKRMITAPVILNIGFMVVLLLVSAFGPGDCFERDRQGPLGRHELELGIVHGRGKVPVSQDRADAQQRGFPFR
jgi:hypothetical protein